MARIPETVSLLSLVDGDLLAVLAQTLEADNTVCLSKQSIVAADTDIYTGVEMGTTLTDKDVASQNVLTIGALGSKALGLGITAVLSGADALLVGEELKTNVHHLYVPSFLKDARGEKEDQNASITSTLSGYSLWS